MEKIVCKSMQIHTTSLCTLRCKNCGFSFPKFEKPMISNIDITLRALDKLFEVYDYINELRVAGAEAFLYPHFNELIRSFTKYKNKIDYGIVITNGTYIPKQEILDTIAGLDFPFMVRVDNYGDLSVKYEELIEVLKKNSIVVDTRDYYGDHQSFGGWIDYGDFMYRNYSDEQLTDLFMRCRNPDDCGLLFDDYLTICGYVTVADWMGRVKPSEDDIIHLLDGHSTEEYRNKILNWRKKPFEACKYCLGFDPENSKRIPAAIQMEE